MKLKRLVEVIHWLLPTLAIQPGSESHTKVEDLTPEKGNHRQNWLLPFDFPPKGYLPKKRAADLVGLTQLRIKSPTLALPKARA